MSRKESKEQKKVAEWLDWKSVDWFHVPNERNTNKVRGSLLKLDGVKKGVPDIVIIQSPPEHQKYSHMDGAVIELKREDANESDITKHQKKWLDKFHRNNYMTAVCFGADEAIDQLKLWGYGGYNA